MHYKQLFSLKRYYQNCQPYSFHQCFMERVVAHQELVLRINLIIDVSIKGGGDLTGISLYIMLQYILRNIVPLRLLLDYCENLAIEH